MIHRCYCGHGGCLPTPESRRCRRGYNDTDLRDRTTFDEKGFPVYARPRPEDLRVVPHNRELSLDMDSHVNVEFCATSYTVLYLYSYLFKGNKKVRFELQNTADVDDNDEITLYLRGRMICGMEAMWKFMGYPTYPASDPPTTKLDVVFNYCFVILNNLTLIIYISI